MQTIATAGDTIDDAMNVEVIVAAVVGLFGGGGVVQLASIWSGRKKGQAEAVKVITDAAGALATQARSMLDDVQARHQNDMREMRSQHAEAMTRLTTNLRELESAFRHVEDENKKLRTEMTLVLATGLRPPTS